MNSSLSLTRRVADSRPETGTRVVPLRIADDMTMLRAAAELTRDLNPPKPLIYWTDLLLSSLVGYGAMAVAILAAAPWVALAAGVVAVLALYRAGSFIHELTHLKHSQVPGFRLAWNLLIGIPQLVPSFMYEGVHSLHHARTRYGTADDPEYLPLALMKPWTVPVFVLVSAVAPLALLLRFGVLTPLALVFPRVRAFLVARYSALSINPTFRRRPPEGELARQWRWQAAGASLWAMTIIAAVASGVVPLRTFAIVLAITSGAMVINQVRTLVAHLWENEGEAISTTAQYLDSVNVPPPGMLPYLWAPVGLRYHALHHLLPGLPYHALGKAHRRLSAALAGESPYHRANHRGLFPLIARLIGGAARRGDAR